MISIKLKSMRFLRFVSLSVFLAIISFAICDAQPSTPPSLYKSFEDHFLIGTALNRAQIFGVDSSETFQVVRADRRGYFYQQQIITDPEGLEMAEYHFNSLTPENVMKWEEIHPEPGKYDFEAADRFVDFAKKHGKYIVAHTLVWHNQTPDWVFLDDEGNELDRDSLLARMEDHIKTVVGRYKGKIQAWDVVNEAFNMDGSFRESKWYQIIGDDFIAKAFEFAHEADPKAELYYNDYALENSTKRKAIIQFAQTLLDQNIPITGIGSQSHLSLSNMPEPEETEQMILDFSELDLTFMITELDINVLPTARNDGNLRRDTDIYANGLPQEIDKKLADAYAGLFNIYLKHSDKIERVTLWGISDSGSWLNYLPMERVNYPLLFDRNNEAKTAFHAIIQAAENYRN